MLCFQKIPFGSKLAILNDNLTIQKNPQYSDKTLTLFKKMLVQNPQDRISAAELIDYLRDCDVHSKIAYNKQIMTTINKSPKQVKPSFFALINKRIKRLTTKSGLLRQLNRMRRVQSKNMCVFSLLRHGRRKPKSRSSTDSSLATPSNTVKTQW